MMEIEVDVDWVTTGMKIIVDSLVTVGEQEWNMKLIGVELILRGRMLFVMHLSKTVLPGISGPHLTVAVIACISAESMHALLILQKLFTCVHVYLCPKIAV
jgi:hypothetical protein